MIRREQAVSENVASRTYAPLVFSKMPEAKGIGKARLEAAMDRLYRIDAIERGYLWRADRQDKFGLREKCADPRDDPTLTDIGSAECRAGGGESVCISVVR